MTGEQDLLTAAFEAERMKAEANSDDQAIDLLQELDPATSERALRKSKSLTLFVNSLTVPTLLCYPLKVTAYNQCCSATIVRVHLRMS